MMKAQIDKEKSGGAMLDQSIDAEEHREANLMK